MDVCTLAQKHKFHFKPPAPLSQRKTGGEREKGAVCLSVCLLPLSSKSVLIKLCRPQNTHTHTTEKGRERERGLSKYAGLFLPFCLHLKHHLSLFVCLCLRAPSHRAWRVTGCVFQPLFEHRAINAGQRERAGVRGGEGPTQLVIDSEFKVWETGGDGLVRRGAGGCEEREKTREERRGSGDVIHVGGLGDTFRRVNFHYSHWFLFTCMCTCLRCRTCRIECV